MLDPIPRLEPEAAKCDGPTVCISSPVGDADVVLYFKSDERAESACNAIRNYLEIVDVDSAHESVMQMLAVVFGTPGCEST